MAEEGADIVVTDLCEQLPFVPYAMGTREELDETLAEVEKRDRRLLRSRRRGGGCAPHRGRGQVLRLRHLTSVLDRPAPDHLTPGQRRGSRPGGEMSSVLRTGPTDLAVDSATRSTSSWSAPARPVTPRPSPRVSTAQT